MAKVKNSSQLEQDVKKASSSAYLALFAADNFVDHFFEMDGNVFYSEVCKLRDAVSNAMHHRSVSNMKYVGPKWDFDKGVTGEYYYEDETT